MTTFSHTLITWYASHKRDLPWRHTRDPYHIWLSEVILQQTRVEQGLPYYQAFIKAFPTVQDLAAAPQEQVLKLWQGLGYYSRARNLHAAAQQVVARGGHFPTTYKTLLDLKGVGAYTAAAIASFSYDEVVPVIDGNVYRVLSRIYGITTAINTGVGFKTFFKTASQLIDKEDPATFNQAIMEYGALHCTPKNPKCNTCVFQSDCVAYKENRISSLPVKAGKTAIKNLFHHYLVVRTPSGKTLLQRRPQQGIWAGLYEFPYIESDGALLPHELTNASGFKKLFEGLRFRESVINQQPIIHKLSHRKIHATFWIITVETEMAGALTLDEVLKKPVHVLVDRFIKSYWNGYL